MIVGSVSPFREPTVTLGVRGPSGQETEVVAVVDTGFSESLTLPPDIISLLDLRVLRRGRAYLADGSEAVFDVYEAELFWDNQWRRVSVEEADTTPLLGMTAMYGYEMVLHIVDGGSLLLQRLP